MLFAGFFACWDIVFVQGSRTWGEPDSGHGAKLWYFPAEYAYTQNQHSRSARMAVHVGREYASVMSIMKTLQTDDRPTSLAQTIAEIGRADKTIHMLTYLEGENKRRRTLQQLNRGESRHTVPEMSFIVSGDNRDRLTVKVRKIS